MERKQNIMISIQKGLEDFNELSITIKGVKDINSLVELIYDNPKYDITNDLRKNWGIIDINYKSICATIKQEKDYLVVLPNIEIWDYEGNLDFININILDYNKYDIKFDNNGELCIGIDNSHNRNYFYAIGNKIFKNNKLIEIVEFDNLNINEVDMIILRLIKLNSGNKYKYST